jgi:hypothetical protein
MLIVIEAICFSGRSLGAVGYFWKMLAGPKLFLGKKKHRKPENFMFSESFWPGLSKFGLFLSGDRILTSLASVFPKPTFF